MDLNNSETREKYIKLMAKHFKHNTTEEELREQIKNDPAVLQDFVDWLADDGKVLLWVSLEESSSTRWKKKN